MKRKKWIISILSIGVITATAVSYFHSIADIQAGDTSHRGFGKPLNTEAKARDASETAESPQVLHTAPSTSTSGSDDTSQTNIRAVAHTPGPPIPLPVQRQTQEKARRDAVLSLYAKLIKELGLSDEQSERLIDLLAASQERLREIQRTGGDSRTHLDQINQHLKNTSDEILALLGTEKFQKYERYQQTLPEHLTVLRLSNELNARSITALSERQEEELYAMLVEEKSLQQPSSNAFRLHSVELVEEQRRETEAYYSRVFDRAQDILTSEQLDIFRAKNDMSKRPWEKISNVSTNYHK